MYSKLVKDIPLITEIIIGENCFKNLKIDFEICNYPHLKIIHINRNSLQCLQSFTISNNDSLKSITIGENACYNVDKLTLQSI